ncbi:FAD-dependent oxidoreductase [Dysosmobacter sp.]|uniref:FAD-dependent oxidoreductase n=1 Tax=Dysosmobacter sp. TaxID=2591382 RepID=UPI002A8BBE7F|nr:FAD-dependent oxidoreductase [Dysosmobacter sp.]MDY3282458.1 FAD-dependent oxidoreductase [Dysosmobacter sp.]
MTQSIWEASCRLPEFPQLREDIRTDVLVIGGGIAGILCAYQLTRAGADCVLAEADRLCGGVTGKTTAKITVQHGLFAADLLSRFGEEKARLYLAANRAALAEYRRLCRTVDCGLAAEDSCVYTLHREDQIRRELTALRQLGAEAEYVRGLPLPFTTAGAVRLRDQARFHPLRFLGALARDLRVYEHTPVRRLEGTAAVTDRGRISARKIIAATHFPFLNKHGSYFLKLYQSRSYVLALKGAARLDAMYVDGSGTGLSFRNEGDVLLLGGGAHRTGKPGGGWQVLEEAARKYYPDAKEVGRWAAQDCMSLDGVPYIGRYSRNTPDLFVATGFHKWGMTSAMAAAMVLRDLVQGRENPYAAVFSPSRTMLRPQLAVNGAGAAASLLTPTRPRCPHMGCALKWNPREQTWDCPCHGSRFTRTGELLDGPAMGDLPRRP